MLIVSKFHDYYDSASVYGIDKTCVYQRKEKSFKIKNYFSYISKCESKKFRYEIKYLVIGFCGHIYPLVVVTKYSGVKIEEDTSFYQSSEALEYLEFQHLVKVRYYGNAYIKREIKSYFERDWSFLEEQFRKTSSPVFLCGNKIDKYNSENNLITNIELKPYKFFKVKDASTAFQDIFMYISGVLGAPAPPMVQVSDKDLQAKRGHDGEYSFKKTPGKKVKWR